MSSIQRSNFSELKVAFFLENLEHLLLLPRYYCTLAVFPPRRLINLNFITLRFCDLCINMEEGSFDFEDREGILEDNCELIMKGTS